MYGLIGRIQAQEGQAEALIVVDDEDQWQALGCGIPTHWRGAGPRLGPGETFLRRGSGRDRLRL